MPKDSRSNQRNLSVTADGKNGLIGHAGAVLLRKLADQCRADGAAGEALARTGKSPLLDRGVALVSMAVAIALGATSMRDIAVLGHLERVLGAAPSDTTVRRTLELADPRTLDRIARARAKVRAHVWQLIAGTAARFPWLAMRREGAGGLAGHRPGRDADHRAQRQGRAAPTFKMGCSASTRWRRGVRIPGECLAMLLRPGNAGENTFADHLTVLTAALRQIPSRMRSKLLVRVEHGASHELIERLLSLSSRRRTVLFTCGWAITEADEQAIGLLPSGAWQAAVDQDGVVQQDKHVAEITHLLGRAAGWPAGLRWIVRRTKPSRRQAKNLTAFERATGWRYSIIVTNIPATGIPGVPGSHHPQFTDVLHRQHAVVEDQVRTNKAMGLYNLPSKTWLVNCGWVLAANIAADLAAWCRLLGLYDCDDLKDAEPGTLRYRLLSLPARLARHARARVLKISRTWPWKDAFLACWHRLCALPAPA